MVTIGPDKMIRRKPRTAEPWTQPEPRNSGALKVWISVLVLVLAAAAGVLVWLLKQPFLALLIMALPLGSMLLYRYQQRMFLAPVIVFVAAAYTNFSIGTGTQSNVVDSFLLTIIFVVIWVLHELIVNHGLHLYPFPINTPIIGFMITVPISIVWGYIFRDPNVVWWSTFIYVQLATATVMIMLPSLTLLIGNQVEDIRIIKFVVGLTLMGAVFGLAWDEHWLNFKVETGGLFTMWVVALTVGLAVFNKKIPLFGRFLLLALAGAWIYYRFGQNITWLAGWLPPFVVLFMITFVRDKRFVVLMAIVGIVLIATNTGYYQHALSAENAQSGGTRLFAWSTNLGLAKNHLLFGMGPGGYAPYLVTYYPNFALASHSNYIDILEETGIVGFIFYVWFFARMAILSYRLVKRTRGRGDFIEAMSVVVWAGIVGCIFSMVLGDWLVPFPYTQGINGFDYIVYSWIFMGFALVLDRMTREKPAEEAQVAGSSSPGGF